MSKLLVHTMPWFGDSHIHRQVSYISNDPAVIDRQLQIMRFSKINNRPILGVIVTWMGPFDSFQHSATMEWCTQCEANGLLFALLLNPWINGTASQTAQSTANVIAALSHVDTATMLNSPAYVPEKFILEFSVPLTSGTGSATADWATIKAQFPDWTFLHQSEGFSWPSVDMTITNPWTRAASSVANLQGQNAHASMQIPGFMVRFDDSGMPTPQGVSLANWTGTRDYNSSVWGPSGNPNRVIEDNAGKFLFDQIAVTPATAPYQGLITWNDYDEGTALEPFFVMQTGIRIGS